MTTDGLRLLQDLRRSLLEPPAQLRPRTVTTSRPPTAPKLSAPSPNLTMKPGTTPADLHRIPDATPDAISSAKRSEPDSSPIWARNMAARLTVVQLAWRKAALQPVMYFAARA